MLGGPFTSSGRPWYGSLADCDAFAPTHDIIPQISTVCCANGDQHAHVVIEDCGNPSPS